MSLPWLAHHDGHRLPDARWCGRAAARLVRLGAGAGHAGSAVMLLPAPGSRCCCC
ncbi:hypothetical protein HBB16_20555 [Pseudonocardia sp. MCCB 268]|nr:hypothetical protein [Pseudonocardia cytotoxica]